MDKLENKIFNILKTKKCANEFLDFSNSIKSLTHHVGDVDVNDIAVKTFGENVPGWVLDVIKMMPGLSSGKIDTSEISVFELVEDMIRKSSEVKIEMSFEPSDEFIDKVLEILKTRLGEKDASPQNFLITIEVNEGADPGALFYIDGRFVDLTVKNQVVNYLSSQDVISRYL